MIELQTAYHTVPTLCSRYEKNFYLRPALFCEITHRIMVFHYRRFGTTYRSRLQGSRIQEFGYLTPENGTDWFSRNVGNKFPLLTA